MKGTAIRAVVVCFTAGSLVVGAPALKGKPLQNELFDEWELDGPVRDDNGRVLVNQYRERYNKDGTYDRTYQGKNPPERCKFTHDPKASPPTIDLDGEFLGIYKIEGDSLTICYSFPGKDRPRVFESRPDKGIYLNRYRRVKRD
jgi:uncharacterized protein (TIGR03067 family)